MKIGFIIQARLGSTRLPGKILLPFYEGKTILDIVINNLRQIKGTSLVVATSESAANDALVEFLDSRNIDVYRGSEDDVLERFIRTAKEYEIDGIVRICSDNPFLDMKDMRYLVEEANRNDVDYIGFKINDMPSIKTHFGFWGEFVKLSALEKVTSLTDDKLYHEHVTNYIYTHPDDFKINWLMTPLTLNGRSDIRLTVDTVDDFQVAQEIYASIKNQNPSFTISDVVNCLDCHPELLKKMKNQIEKNSK